MVSKKATLFENYPDIVSVTDFCEMFGISRKSAYKLIKEDIKYIDMGGKFLIPKQNIIDYLYQNMI